MTSAQLADSRERTLTGTAGGRSPALWSGIYGALLGVLVGSTKWTFALVDLFVLPGFVLGTHEEDWIRWHAVGCAFVGIINVRSVTDGDWNLSARRSLALASAFVFGTWGVQNFMRMFADPPRFKTFMWSQVVLCLATGVWNLVHYVRLGRSANR